MPKFQFGLESEDRKALRIVSEVREVLQFVSEDTEVLQFVAEDPEVSAKEESCHLAHLIVQSSKKTKAMK